MQLAPTFSIGIISAIFFVACAQTISSTTPTAPPAPTFAAESTVPRVESTPNLLLPEAPPPGATNEFKTDFTKHTVSYQEIFSGGPPKDGIPTIDAPKFVTVNDADTWLKPNEPVILVEQNGDARAYPYEILQTGRVVNDAVGGKPIAVFWQTGTASALDAGAIANGRDVGAGIAYSRAWMAKRFRSNSTARAVEMNKQAVSGICWGKR
jgi:hypothetical protein